MKNPLKALQEDVNKAACTMHPRVCVIKNVQSEVSKWI